MKKVIIALSIAIATLSASAECYSEGVRVGVVQKFSTKGYINKSWEGELVMEGEKIKGSSSGIRGGNVWAFSVLDANVAKTINDVVMSGTPIALKYCEVAFQIGQTDTKYRITQAVIRK